MKKEIKEKLDDLFEEIEKLNKKTDLLHISGSKSDFTQEVEQLRAMHESITKDYDSYQKAEPQGTDEMKNSLLKSHDDIHSKLQMVKRDYEDRNK